LCFNQLIIIVVYRLFSPCEIQDKTDAIFNLTEEVGFQGHGDHATATRDHNTQNIIEFSGSLPVFSGFS
jgi:hypothetical protein